jgi:hypothetical protein
MARKQVTTEPSDRRGRPAGKARPQHRRRQARQDAADVRLTARADRTPGQQIKTLDSRLGAGVGAERERERLSHLS